MKSTIMAWMRQRDTIRKSYGNERGYPSFEDGELSGTVPV